MRSDAVNIFTTAVQAVMPGTLMAGQVHRLADKLKLGDHDFERQDIGKLFVIGAGKASAAMAQVVELKVHFDESPIDAGVIVTKYEHAFPLQKIRCIEAGHPLPDDNSVLAGKEITQLLQEAGENDVVIALISGGASSLLVDLPPGISLQALQTVFDLLLQSGGTIEEMNTVRKHLSPGIKGGQLARAAWPARIISFILSDVIGNPLDIIASGPTVPDQSTFADAWQIVQQYALTDKLPAPVVRWLQMGLNNEIPETPKPGDLIFEKSSNYLLGTNRIALEAAANKAAELGYTPVIVTDTMRGEASVVAQSVVDQVKNYAGARPACLLLGGETTVTIKGNGKGGRNQEFALAALIALQAAYPAGEGMPLLLSAGTDGTDGPTNAAGAFADTAVLEYVTQQALVPEAYLAQNDSYTFFEKASGHLFSGPTHTNVMDIVVVLIP